jgi:hypothetical protein
LTRENDKWFPAAVCFFSHLFVFPFFSFFSNWQEIDGPSLLLMKRNDVVGNMGLKLGPAVKIYNHIRRLQTRRDDLIYA